MPTVKMSFEATIKYAAAQAGPFTDLAAERDVTLNMEMEEADSSSRGNGGERTSEPSLRATSVEFDMIYEPGETGFEAIKDAFLGRTSIALQILDDDGEGYQGDFKIFGFTRNEGLADAMTVSVVAKPCRSDTPPTWIGGS